MEQSTAASYQALGRQIDWQTESDIQQWRSGVKLPGREIERIHTFSLRSQALTGKLLVKAHVTITGHPRDVPLYARVVMLARTI